MVLCKVQGNVPAVVLARVSVRHQRRNELVRCATMSCRNIRSYAHVDRRCCGDCGTWSGRGKAGCCTIGRARRWGTMQYVARRMAQSGTLHVTRTAMAKKSDKQQASPLDEVRRHVRVFVDLGRIAGESNDQNRFLDQVVVQVARAVEIDHVKVLRYRRREADLLVVAGFGWNEGVAGSATLSADLRSPPGRSFQTAQPVVIKNFQGQDDFIHSGLLQEHGITSLANVPVLIGGAAWGVLEVDSTRAREFNQDTIEFLTATAALIGAFLKNHGGEPSEAARLAAIAMQAQNREVLLREMQHRVKNNFQIVLASIAIQKRRYPAGDTQRALDHIASRINAISLAHDQLAPGEKGQIVKLSDYLRALCQAIKQQAEGIDLEVQADELELSIDRAVPLGLILNEIVTNSIKHAFGSDGGGRISVRLVAGVGYGEARLSVADNGRGIKEPNPAGSGLRLIAALARQIGGTVDQDSSTKGTTTWLTFPLMT
jgi:two-component sensor histidine kinase